MRPVDRDVLLRPAIGMAARRLETGHGSSTLRSGWYAYRATGTDELPSWAVEIALTIERPVASTVDAPDGGPIGGSIGGGSIGGGPTGGGPTGGGPTGGGPTGGGPTGGPTSRGPTDRGTTGDGSKPTGAGGSSARMRRSERPLGPGSRGPWALPPQSWADESLAPFAPEPEPRSWGRPAQAMVLVRAPGRLRWLDGIAEAIVEVETVAGVRPAELEDDLVEATGGRRGPRLRTGPVLPGLTPATAADAAAHLRIAGSRGLPAPLRRRRPAMGAVELAWRAGAGCVLTCDGPDGRSAQAVVGLRGMGNAVAIAPPPGGALVLRAWQARAGWGVACGLVLGAPAILGLGREARRVADVARSEGWDASVLSGSAAVQLARAGSPRRPAPRALAQAATRTQVAALFQACLTAGELAVRS